MSTHRERHARVRELLATFSRPVLHRFHQFYFQTKGASVRVPVLRNLIARSAASDPEVILNLCGKEELLQYLQHDRRFLLPHLDHLHHRDLVAYILRCWQVPESLSGSSDSASPRGTGVDDSAPPIRSHAAGATRKRPRPRGSRAPESGVGAMARGPDVGGTWGAHGPPPDTTALSSMSASSQDLPFLGPSVPTLAIGSMPVSLAAGSPGLPSASHTTGSVLPSSTPWSSAAASSRAAHPTVLPAHGSCSSGAGADPAQDSAVSMEARGPPRSPLGVAASTAAVTAAAAPPWSAAESRSVSKDLAGSAAPTHAQPPRASTVDSTESMVAAVEATVAAISAAFEPGGAGDTPAAFESPGPRTRSRRRAASSLSGSDSGSWLFHAWVADPGAEDIPPPPACLAKSPAGIIMDPGEGSRLASHFRKAQELGTGGFGTTYRVVERASGREYALKEVKLSCGELDPEIQHEVEMMVGVSHPRIVRYYGSFLRAELSGDVEVRYFCVVMELGRTGNLADLIEKPSPTPLPMVHALSYTRDICLALDYLHTRRRVLHRDVKPENIVICNHASVPFGVAKLVDFGLAAVARTSGLSTQAGTQAYSSPEMLTYSKYSSADDMWAVAMLMSDMATGQLAYDFRGSRHERRAAAKPLGLDRALINHRIKEVQAVDPKVGGIVKRLLDKAPAQRPSAAKVITFCEHALHARYRHMSDARHRHRQELHQRAAAVGRAASSEERGELGKDDET